MTDGPVTIFSSVRELVSNGCTVDEAADKVLARAKKSDLVAFLRPLVVNEATRVKRCMVNALEGQADRMMAAGEDPIAVRAKLAAECFALPDGTYVQWGKATVDQHLARSAWQRQRGDACYKDAARHESAAAAITAAGATCLDDIGDSPVSEHAAA